MISKLIFNLQFINCTYRKYDDPELMYISASSNTLDVPESMSRDILLSYKDRKNDLFYQLKDSLYILIDWNRRIKRILPSLQYESKYNNDYTINLMGCICNSENHEILIQIQKLTEDFKKIFVLDEYKWISSKILTSFESFVKSNRRNNKLKNLSKYFKFLRCYRQVVNELYIMCEESVYLSDLIDTSKYDYPYKCLSRNIFNFNKLVKPPKSLIRSLNQSYELFDKIIRLKEEYKTSKDRNRMKLFCYEILKKSG